MFDVRQFWKTQFDFRKYNFVRKKAYLRQVWVAVMFTFDGWMSVNEDAARWRWGAGMGCYYYRWASWTFSVDQLPNLLPSF